MAPPTQPNLLRLPGTDELSSLVIKNLTGKFINLPNLTLSPEGDEHKFKSFRAGEKNIGGVDFYIHSFHLSPLPEQTANVLIIVSEEMAKHYANRQDVFYPVPDETELYPSGAPHRYKGLARYIPSNSVGARAHPDGF